MLQTCSNLAPVFIEVIQIGIDQKINNANLDKVIGGSLYGVIASHI